MASSRNSRSMAVSLAGIALLAAAGCSNASKNVSLTEASTGPAKVLKVATVRAVTRQVSSSVQVTGSFLAEESSDVAPPAAGRVIETPVDAGAFVQEGQILAKLEDRDAQLRLEAALASEQQAEASLRQAESHIGLVQGGKFDANNVPEVLSAKASYDSALAQAKNSEADAQRYGALIKTGDVSQSAYDKARTQSDTAKEQTNSARQLYEASLNAARQKFSGRDQRASVAGGRARPNRDRPQSGGRHHHQGALYRLYQRAPHGSGTIRGANREDRDAGSRYAAQAGTAGPGIERAAVEDRRRGRSQRTRLSGPYVPRHVTSINPTVDSNSRTVSVEAKFANQDLALKPGMFATARILLNGSSMGIFLPRATVLTDPSTNSSQVFFIRDGKARVAVVQLGAVDGDMIQILSGISADFVVASNHLQDLYDGEPVDIEPVPAAVGAIPAEPRASLTGPEASLTEPRASASGLPRRIARA